MSAMTFKVSSLTSLAVAFAAAFAMPAWAQDPILVTASRTPVPPQAQTAALSTVTEDDLNRRQTVFATEVLATLPGVTVTQNGGFGGVASIRLRGLSASQTLVLIDGVPVGDASSPDGAYNPAFLDAAEISDIAVLRGPQSTLWGSSALGGVVAVATRRPDPGLSARGFLEGGSFGLVRAGAGLGYGTERFDLRLDASGIGVDGISKADERDGATESDGYDGLSVGGRFGWQPIPSLRVEAFGRRNEAATEFDQFGLVTGVRDGGQRDETTSETYGGQARWRPGDGRVNATALIARATIDRTSIDPVFGPFATAGERDLIRLQADWRATDRLDLVVGADREEQAIQNAPGTRIDGVFATAQVTPVADLTLSAGVRHDDHSQFGGVTTGRLGVRYAPFEAFGLRASFGQGFKAPSVFQLTSSFGALPPNLSLRPEKGEGWDAAVFGTLLDGRLTYELGVFDLSVTDQIDFDFLASRYENLAQVDSRGLEAQVRLRLSPTLQAALSYTLTEAENGAGARLLQIPEHAAFAQIDWQATPTLGLTLSVRHNGEEPAIPFPANPSGVLDGWTRADLAARYALSPRLEVYGRVENLTDEAYQDVLGYGTPGRSAFAGLRVRL
jgi:vitamin B12 transporter